MNHKLELLGIVAAKDRELKNNLLKALQQLGLDIPVEEVREIDRLLAYGISGIPALILDGRVLFQQVVPSVEDLQLVLGILLNHPVHQLNIRHIVVPTDFSETAQNAYQYALDLARFVGAKVRLVHIHQTGTDIGSALLFDGVSEELHYKQELLESWSLSGAQKVRVEKEQTLEVVPEMINGFVIDELRALSRRKETDLIVMGATGENKLLGRFLGGISSEVARKAFCPVLLVPRNSKFEPYTKVVYACNYQANEREILHRVVRLVERFKSELHLVHIVTGKEQAFKAQDLSAGSLQVLKLSALFLSRVANPDVLSGLIEYTDDQEAGLMVMNTVHRPFLEDTFRHNLTRDMAFHTHVPLLIMHAED